MTIRHYPRRMTRAYIRPINYCTDVESGESTHCQARGCRQPATVVALWRLAGLPRHLIHSKILCDTHASIWRNAHTDIAVDDYRDIYT